MPSNWPWASQNPFACVNPSNLDETLERLTGNPESASHLAVADIDGLKFATLDDDKHGAPRAPQGGGYLLYSHEFVSVQGILFG